MTRNSVLQESWFISHPIADHHNFQEHILGGTAGYGCIVSTGESISPTVFSLVCILSVLGSQIPDQLGVACLIKLTGWVGMQSLHQRRSCVSKWCLSVAPLPVPTDIPFFQVFHK